MQNWRLQLPLVWVWGHSAAGKGSKAWGSPRRRWFKARCVSEGEGRTAWELPGGVSVCM